MTTELSFEKSHEEYALNKTNLALIGALDDFDDVYRAVCDIYEPFMKEAAAKKAQTSNWVPDTGFIDKLVRKEVKAICDPLLDQYKMIFTDDSKRLYLKVTKFSMENFIPLKEWLDFELRVKTFSEFLNQLQSAVTSTLYGRRLAEKPKYLYEPFVKEVNDHIEKYIAEHDINSDNGDPTENHELTGEPLHLYSCLSSTVCHRDRHPVVPAIYYGRSEKNEGVVRLPVHYCEQCEKYYIGAMTYSMYEKICGPLVIEKYRYDSSGIEFEKFNNESRLHRFGYIVVEGGLSEPERHKLLVFLIKNDMMTYEEISATIEQDIRQFSNHPLFGPAVSKWKSDQKYISDLVISNKISKNK